MKFFGQVLLSVGGVCLILAGIVAAVKKLETPTLAPISVAVVTDELPLPAPPPEPEPVQPVALDTLETRVQVLEALLVKQHEIIVEVQQENDRLRKLLDIEQKASTP